MTSRERPLWKVCCISSLDEADRAVAAGADVLGLVSAMPSGPGVVDDDVIASIIAHARRAFPAVRTFLLTSSTSAPALIAQHARCPASALQLCDRLDDGALPALRAALPGVEIVQVIHVQGADDVDEALALVPLVDALLLDSGRPGAAIQELGGTGRVHDWRLSRAIVDGVARSPRPVPVFLAGGRHADNVADALAAVAAAGVDVCSGVRAGGRLDDARLQAFATALGSGIAVARSAPGVR